MALVSGAYVMDLRAKMLPEMLVHFASFITHHLHFSSHFPGELWGLIARRALFLQLLWEEQGREPLEIMAQVFLWARCPYCPISRVKAFIEDCTNNADSTNDTFLHVILSL